MMLQILVVDRSLHMATSQFLDNDVPVCRGFSERLEDDTVVLATT
jgi:hypothetical protein